MPARCLTMLLGALFALTACEGPPARLVAGFADTVVVNHLRPVQVPFRVLDAAGHVLPDTGVRLQWRSGVPVSVSERGAVTCTRAGDATLRASLGSLVTPVVVRCRPVHKVLGGGMLTLMVGDPPQDLAFAPVDSAGRPVTPIAAQVSYDSAVVTLEGWRIRARGQGETSVEISIGEGWAHWWVLVYERVPTLEGIRPGQHLAVPVRLAGGEQSTWQLPATPRNYLVTVLPDRDTLAMPRLAIVGANCGPGLTPHSYECVALHGGSVIAYHPRDDEPGEEWRGTIAVWRSPCLRSGPIRLRGC